MANKNKVIEDIAVAMKNELMGELEKDFHNALQETFKEHEVPSPNSFPYQILKNFYLRGSQKGIKYIKETFQGKTEEICAKLGELQQDQNIKSKYEQAIEEWNTLEFTNDKGTVMVEWEYLDEGHSGDYQPDDIDDEPLLRYTVYRKEGKEWLQVDDASYCTLVSILTPKEKLEKLARAVIVEVESKVESRQSIKRICEGLSHMDGTEELTE